MYQNNDDFLKKSERILMEFQSEKIPDIVKTDQKGLSTISYFERQSIFKSRFARQTESKFWWAVNLFNSWLENRKSKSYVCDSKSFKIKKGDISVEILF